MNRELDLKALVGLLSRQALFIVATVALVLVVALVALAFVPNTYRAAAVLEIDTARRDSLGRVVGSENAAADNARVENEVEIVLTDAVLLDVVESQRLFEDPEFAPTRSLPGRLLAGLRGTGPEAGSASALAATADRLRSAVEAERIGLTYLISVSASSQSAEKAALLANAVAEAYIRQQVDAKLQAAGEVQNVVTARLDAATAAIEEAAGRFDQLIVDNAADIATLSGQADIAQTGARLQEALATRTRSSLLIDLVQRNVAVENWPQVAEDLQSQTILALEQQRAAIAGEIAALPDASADADALGTRLEEVETQLAAEAEAAIGQLEGALVEADRQAAELRDAFRTDVITRRLSNLTPQLDSEFAQAVREGTLAQERVEALLQRQSELADEVGLRLADARIASPAIAPAGPSAPNARLVLLLAGILALGLAFALAILRETYSGGVRDARAIDGLAGARFGASLPNTRRRRGQASIADEVTGASLAPYPESVRRLRLATERSASPKEGPRTARILMVSSAQAQDGRTTTALALARSFAANGRTVLLWLRDAPDAAPASPPADLAAATPPGSPRSPALPMPVRDNRSSVDILTGRGSQVGKDAVEPSRILSEASQRYDIVVLDVPPMARSADSLALAPLVDQILFLVRWSKTPLPAVRAALGQLRERVGPSRTVTTVLVGDEGDSLLRGGDGLPEAIR